LAVSSMPNHRITSEISARARMLRTICKVESSGVSAQRKVPVKRPSSSAQNADSTRVDSQPLREAISQPASASSGISQGRPTPARRRHRTQAFDTGPGSLQPAARAATVSAVRGTKLLATISPNGPVSVRPGGWRCSSSGSSGNTSSATACGGSPQVR
jgi:hypothetical protein